MDTLAETLWREFAVETEEHLEAVAPLLAQDRQRLEAADITQLFRSFHSIKGLARALDVRGMETLAHEAENLLGLVRDGRAAMTSELADLLLHAVDGLERMRDAVVERQQDVPADLGLIAALGATFADLGGAGAGAPPPAPAGSAAPLHEDPEMLGIFVEMVQARGPALCAGLADDAGARAAALDAAQTLAHAAAVMKFDPLAAGLGGLRDLLEPLASAGVLDDGARQQLLERLVEVRRQIELLGKTVPSAALVAAAEAAFLRLAAHPEPGSIADLAKPEAAEQLPAPSATMAAGAAAERAARPASAANLIRVRGEIVDRFLDDIGELRVVAAGLSHQIRGVGSRSMLARARALADRLPLGLRGEFQETFRDFRERDRRLLETEELVSRMLGRLHQSALELRVVPIDAVFNRVPRMVHDLAHRLGKSVELSLEGRDVRIDKGMVEALADPLIHMVRNAIDHGIEPPEERRAAGKPERGTLTLRAAQHGSEIRIAVGDDGRGLDVEAIRARAVAQGLASAAQAAALPDREVFHFIFVAGLSTAATVTATSGRGVGLDVVRTTVRRLNGDVDIRSERGRGTTFTLALPVSAALQTALLVRVGEQSLAIPERHVLAVAEIATDAIRLVGSHRAVLHREAMLPLYGLADLLGMGNGAPAAARPVEPIVVATNGRQMIGLEVDAIEQRQELFLKDLDPRLANLPGVGGASVLGDGRIVLVLDGEELVQLAARGIEHRSDAMWMPA